VKQTVIADSVEEQWMLGMTQQLTQAAGGSQ